MAKKPTDTKKTPPPDELVLWRSPNDGQWYVTRFAATGDIRSVSSGYENRQDALDNIEAQERPAVWNLDVSESGSPEWLTPRAPRRRERGRWARRNRGYLDG